MIAMAGGTWPAVTASRPDAAGDDEDVVRDRAAREKPMCSPSPL